MFGISREEVEAIRRKYPIGTRIVLDYTSDPWTSLMPGSAGTVRNVDDAGTVHVNWDCGSSLGMVLGEDSFHVMDA